MTVWRVAEHRLMERLRYSAGLSYGVHWSYEPLTAAEAHLVFWADARDENTERVRDALRATFEELAESGVSERELAEDLDELYRPAASPGFVASGVARAGRDELLGAEFKDIRRDHDAQTAVTTPDTAAAAAEALATMLLAVPGGDEVPGLAPYPIDSPDSVVGKPKRLSGVRARLRRLEESPHLVVGDEGITRNSEGRRTTVRFDECEAALRWTDGTRGLWSRDGFYLELAPEVWQDGPEIVALVDARVPPERVVAMEPELEARNANVDAAVEGRLKRGFMTSSELNALPGLLEDGETLVTATRADVGWRAGVLAVTDRRALFLYLDEVVFELPLASVRSATRATSTWTGNHLVVETDGETRKFTEVPEERLDELVEALQPDSG
jgi:hypothetical protein